MGFNLPNRNQTDEKQKREKELEAKRNQFLSPEIKDFINQSSFKEAANVEAELNNIKKQPQSTSPEPISPNTENTTDQKKESPSNTSDTITQTTEKANKETPTKNKPNKNNQTKNTKTKKTTISLNRKKDPKELKVCKIDTYLPESTYNEFIQLCHTEQRSQAAMLRIIIQEYIENLK